MGAARALAPENLNPDIRGLLPGCLLFAEIESAILDSIAPLFELVHFASGDPIILENENNDHVYFVIKGSVEIVSYVADEKRVQRQVLLKSGMQFADLSVLTKSNKSSSAYAYEDTQVLRVHGSKFLEILQRFPTVSRKLVLDLATLNERVETAHEIIPIYHATQLKVQREITDLIPLASWKKFGIIPLSLKGGLLSVAMKDPNNIDFFQYATGQLSKVEINAYFMDENEFEPALESVAAWLKNPQSAATKPRSEPAIANDTKELLTVHPLFSGLSPKIHQQLEAYLKPVTLKAGQVFPVPTAGNEAFFVIQKGQIEVNRAVPQSRGRAHVMALGSGDVFGEVHLLTGHPTQHVYRALEETIIVPVPKAVVDQLMGTPVFSYPLATILAKRLQKLIAQAGIRFFKQNETPDLKSVVNLIPISVITEEEVIPLRLSDGEVCVGSVNSNQKHLSAILGRYLPDYRIRFLNVTLDQFKGYTQQLRTLMQAGSDNVHVQVATNRVQQSDPVKILEEILLHGITSRASDIHFEPTSEHLTVRYRIDGVMHERQEKVPIQIGRDVVGRIKVLSQMDIGNQKITQDGQLKLQIEDIAIVARASVLPIKHGEKVVLRLVRGQNNVVPLNMLVPDRRAIQILQHVTRCRQGLFLVTGPTGSGKTTTLYSMLREINRVGVNVVTLEDPVEMEIPGLNQCEIERKRGLDFGHALRAVLRQDPDVIMVGEIRDEESAKIVFEAAVTGHLVLSTLHTSFAVDVGPRLKELGVPATTVAAGLLGVLTQRLVRAVCKKCVTSRPITESEKGYIRSILPHAHLPEEMRFGKGCPSCNNTGYHDRLPVLEIWRNTLPMHKALIDQASPIELIEVAKQDGFESLIEFGVKLALSGLTTLEEVKRCLSSV